MFQILVLIISNSVLQFPVSAHVMTNSSTAFNFHFQYFFIISIILVLISNC